MADSRLFKPLAVGKVVLKQRIGMCPLTRFRASDEKVPTPVMKEYYTQRGSVPGTLIVTEGTFISEAQSGFDNVPGIYNDAQVAAWRDITDAVHAKGSYIFCQLWALGRAANPEVAAREGITISSSSTIPIDDTSAVPTAMTVEQIQQTVRDYATAAENAVRAGFDGVEIHGANGYLVDQFTQDTCNDRTDEYGGSVEARSRFAVEVVAAVVAAIGPERTGIRLSPWGRFQSMRMADPVQQFTDVISKIAPFGIAFLHLVESYVDGSQDVESSDKLDFAYNLWNGPLLVAGGHNAASARKLVDEQYPNKDIVVMFGRYFISNPDLPFRIRAGLDLNPYLRETFYIPKSLEGYTDYPFSKEFLLQSATQLA
ncbi:hypothetical protein QBC33DRAFT_550022 [Phialemonium atrogriseum]|uniref:NADH:flavin oxidoreductase/NADH oxidase N-terminal domain-containing protein n=1 Tax=Phialemonium atrogriseum TaxID=1093897 RepID=A0AAJ0BSC7_9PEZI|nr:uncharacterized protein QBC33DRAFT_550022 [Phialemonium atrogriseum]KAK1763381.1 hypothetical protein QBC33DRAFT_550022 [Phialemonium atrogriseum]